MLCSISRRSPESIALVLVSQAEADAARMLADLRVLLRASRMALLPPDVLVQVSAASPSDHPIRELLDIEMNVALEKEAVGTVASGPDSW